MNAVFAREELVAKARRMSEISIRLGLQRLGTTILEDTHRRLQESRVRAVVIGEIKHGKSTLINALLGQAILPMGVTPTTGATVTVRALRSGERGGAFEVDRGGSRNPLEADRFSVLARGSRPGQSESNGPAGALEYAVEGSSLPLSLDLVDTPGINDLSRLRAAVSQGELPRADILVLVLDATQLLNRTELTFLTGAVAAVGGLEDSGAHLLLAVNRIDLIAERERPKLVEHLKRELVGLNKKEGPSDTDVGACPYEIFLTDARTTLRDPESTTPGVQGTRELRDRLYELAAKHDEMLPARARASLLRFGTLLGHNAAIAARAASLELGALSREVAEVRRELAHNELDLGSLRKTMLEARERLLNQATDRIAAFQGPLSKSIEATINTASQRTLTTHLAPAIHDAFLAFAHEESERLRSALEDVTRTVIHTHSEQLGRRLAHAAMRLGFRGPTIYIEPPSALLEAGLVAIGIAGTAVMYFGHISGLIMAVAGPLTTVFLREKSIRDARARARTELPKALDLGAAALREQIRKVIDGHFAALEEYVLLANVALREQLEGVLGRVETELGTELQGLEQRRERTQASVREIELEIANIRNELQTMGTP